LYLFFPEFFTIKEVIKDYLEELVLLQTIKPSDFEQNLKERNDFSETTPFDAPLPFVTMFFLRPFYSNLLMSPELNTRHVPCDVFNTVPQEKNDNLRDILYQSTDAATASFRSRQIILFPYKIEKGTDDTGTNGVPIKSVSSYKIKEGNSTMNNIVVELDEVTAKNITITDFHKLMALFGRSVDGRDGVCNFDNLFNIRSKITEYSELQDLINEFDFPTELIDIKLRHEVNMRNLGSFIMMCTPIYFGAPEGQTRLEAVSRPCFGYPLYGIAPLCDMKSKFVTDFKEDEFFAENVSLPFFSTAYKSVQGSVIYYSDRIPPPFGNSQLQALVELSKMVQDMSSIEINTTYQTFYQLLVHRVSSMFTSQMKPIDEAALAQFNVTYETAKQREERAFFIHEKRITSLYKTLNDVLIDTMFSSRPFNVNIPQNPNDKRLKCTSQIFKDLTGKDMNWFIQKPFYSVFQSVIKINFEESDKKKERIGVIDEDYFLPTGLNRILFTSPKLDKIFKICRWGNDPSPCLLFEMMFTVFGLESLLETFKAYLLKFEATSRFYHPVWLSAYVFLPISTIHEFYATYYLKKIFDYPIAKSLAGKYAPVSKKIMFTIRAVLLQEYLQTIMNFAGEDKFKDEDNFMDFHVAQDSSFQEWSTSKQEKLILVAKEYMEMILLTLPEKLHEAIFVDKTFEPFQGCDFENLTGLLLQRPNETSERTRENMKTFQKRNTLPSINDILPKNIIPSFIMQDKTIASEYTTRCLRTATQQRTPKKKKGKTLKTPHPLRKLKKRRSLKTKLLRKAVKKKTTATTAMMTPCRKKTRRIQHYHHHISFFM
jgi:hypothetical protein